MPNWDAPFAVVLEDDFAFLGPLGPVLEALAREADPSWDVVKLYGRPRRFKRLLRRLPNGHGLIREPFISKFCVGQVISRRGAEKLLAGTLPMHRPVDVEMQYPWETGIDLLAVAPSLVHDVGRSLDESSTKEPHRPVDTGQARPRGAPRLWLRTGRLVRSLAWFAGKRSADRAPE